MSHEATMTIGVHTYIGLLKNERAEIVDHIRSLDDHLSKSETVRGSIQHHRNRMEESVAKIDKGIEDLLEGTIALGDYNVSVPVTYYLNHRDQKHANP